MNIIILPKNIINHIYLKNNLIHSGYDNVTITNFVVI